jgi:1-acyl-sn-glycerol-3-phosphate acyltransferase
MTTDKKTTTFGDKLKMQYAMLPIRGINLLLKLLYRFRIEGRENVPEDGPVIILYSEPSLLTTLLEASVTPTFFGKLYLDGKVLNLVGEELWNIEFFRKNFDSVAPTVPSQPHGGGLLGLGLLEAINYLNRGGVFLTNPDGDMARDGRPMPMGRGAAWVGLHTAAPMVPIVPAISLYDTWPPWKFLPSLRGRVIQRVGKPFKVAEEPVRSVGEEAVAKANARIAAEIERLTYGPGGVAEWAGPPKKNGKPLEEPADLLRAAADQVVVAESPPVVGAGDGNGSMISNWKRGLPLLLWRCPVCLTNDALLYKHRRFGPDRLRCQACDTRWTVHREYGKDFRLKVVEGPPDLLDLDMALTTWYDEMKRDFQPSPIPASGLDLEPGEEVYLRTGGVKLVPYRSNPLFDSWTGREPPKDRVLRRSEAGQYGTLGVGELLLTNRRLVWEGPEGGLDFWLKHFTDVTLRLFFQMKINYEATPYRFEFAEDTGLKWLTYVATVVQEPAAEMGRQVTLSRY